LALPIELALQVVVRRATIIFLDHKESVLSWARIKLVAFTIRSGFLGSTNVGNLTVFGPSAFRIHIINALKLLETKSPDAYGLIQSYIYAITYSKSSAVFATDRPAAIMVGRPTAYDALDVLAAGLAHEAFHCKLYWDFRDEHAGQEVPPNVFSGPEGERKCVEFQCKVLEQLGAAQEIVRATRDALKTGYWEVAWEHRTW
jgi:hypothetical protein